MTKRGLGDDRFHDPGVTLITDGRCLVKVVREFHRAEFSREFGCEFGREFGAEDPGIGGTPR
ncbi:hypothetical protein [Streptomyces hainanensis]|uniref:Uncharacterized protein n=1 Tax=Streptomyces hainanensis TaxID=402648 RepID=A0A4R4SGE4_9ACTN|nr:hypothetical protein [Streptomyces hainanensis]TDC61052.1 hypothetical protein E1283_35695 [Streptomyces hainanensis]